MLSKITSALPAISGAVIAATGATIVQIMLQKRADKSFDEHAEEALKIVESDDE